MKTAIIGAWLLGLGAIGVSVDVNSFSGRLLMVGLGVLPPMVLLRIWQQPAPTMSESIREVLR
jgi:hypothetical protein